jgi:hypothetical protein
MEGWEEPVFTGSTVGGGTGWSGISIDAFEPHPNELTRTEATIETLAMNFFIDFSAA